MSKSSGDKSSKKKSPVSPEDHEGQTDQPQMVTGEHVAAAAAAAVTAVDITPDASAVEVLS